MDAILELERLHKTYAGGVVALQPTDLAIRKGEIDQIKEAMEQSLTPGCETFEQALFKLYQQGLVSKDEALRNSDSATNLSWLINNFEQKVAGKLGESPTGRVMVKPGGTYSFNEIKLNVDTDKQ